jgi:hypothetical protein
VRRTGDLEAIALDELIAAHEATLGDSRTPHCQSQKPADRVSENGGGAPIALAPLSHALRRRAERRPLLLAAPAVACPKDCGFCCSFVGVA